MSARSRATREKARKKGEPSERALKIVTGGDGEDSVRHVTGRVGEEFAAYTTMVGPRMADNRSDGGTTSRFASDAFGHAAALSGDEHPKLTRSRRILAALAAVGDDASRVAPIRASIPGSTDAEREALARTFTRAMNRPPLERSGVVATYALTPTS